MTLTTTTTLSYYDSALYVSKSLKYYDYNTNPLIMFLAIGLQETWDFKCNNLRDPFVSTIRKVYEE